MPKTFLFQAFQFSQTVLIETIKFSISMQLVLFNPLIGSIRCYYFGPEWTWEWWQWLGTPHSPKLQHYWNLTITLFSIMCRTIVGEWGSCPSVEKQSVYSTAPADWASWRLWSNNLISSRAQKLHWSVREYYEAALCSLAGHKDTTLIQSRSLWSKGVNPDRVFTYNTSWNWNRRL